LIIRNAKIAAELSWNETQELGMSRKENIPPEYALRSEFDPGERQGQNTSKRPNYRFERLHRKIQA
jgi:hypothetical protein